MKEPVTISIKDNGYKVVYADRLLKTRVYPELVTGLCYKHVKSIAISRKTDDMQETVLHEVLHGIAREYKLPYRNDLEEEMVSILSEGLIQVMRDNRPFVRWLIQDDIKTMMIVNVIIIVFGAILSTCIGLIFVSIPFSVLVFCMIVMWLTIKNLNIVSRSFGNL